MTGPKWRYGLNRKRAQAVLELATFGAVILFIIGLIINQGLSSAYQQNSALQSMRLAMLQSYRSSQKFPTETAYNTTTFVLVDDRLSEGANRYGATDRQSIVASGSGSLTKNVFFPVDAVDLGSTAMNDKQMSTMLASINGQTFWFRLADYVSYRIQYWPSSDYQASRVTISLMGAGCGAATCTGPDTNCGVLIGDSNEATVRTKFDEQARRLKFEWWWWPEADSYLPFYRSLAKQNKGFENPLKEDGSECSDMVMMRRYDLNRDGHFPDMCCLNPLKYIIWRWTWKSITAAATEINVTDGVYPNFDVDGDLNEETLYRVEKHAAGCWGYDVTVVDWDAGDIFNSDDASNYASSEDSPGLKSDMRIYSFQGSGAAQTYLDITENPSLCVDGGGNKTSCARSILKRNNADLVSRRFVLNRKMLGGYVYTTGGVPDFTGSLCPAGSSRNPAVEVCCVTPGCCESDVNISRTCFMALTTKKVLYIRSNIYDKRGRAWLTDTFTKKKF
jgi:hypothetical protein